MWSSWMPRYCLPFFLAVLFSVTPGAAQKPPGMSSASTGPSARPTANATNSLPSSGISSRRPMFFDGAVQFDDGSHGFMDVRIERICNGSVTLQAHPDSKGRFSFQVGNTGALDLDASDASTGNGFPGSGGSYSGASSGGRTSNASGLGSSPRIGQNCELRAAFPGYRSDLFSVSILDNNENVHVGTLILHRLAAVQGTTISMTTASAPKKAEKDYDKGLQLSQKGDLPGAEEHLQKALALYPQYAIAWSALGDVQQQQKRGADARLSYQRAIACDAHYVTPYNQIAYLAGQESKWQESVDYSKRVIDLNPVEFPSAYWYNAVANSHLQHWAEAEKSGRALLKLDVAHQYPQAEHLVGYALFQNGDFAGAADHMRAYLRDSPNAQDAEAVKKLLAQLNTKAAPATP